MFQRVGFSSSASVSPGGMSGAEEGAGQQPLQCPSPPGSSLFREQLGRGPGGSVPLCPFNLRYSIYLYLILYWDFI